MISHFGKQKTDILIIELVKIKKLDGYCKHQFFKKIGVQLLYKVLLVSTVQGGESVWILYSVAWAISSVTALSLSFRELPSQVLRSSQPLWFGSGLTHPLVLQVEI